MKHARSISWFAVAVAVPTVVWGLLSSPGPAPRRASAVAPTGAVAPSPKLGHLPRPMLAHPAPVPMTDDAMPQTGVGSPVFREARALQWPDGFAPPPGPLMPRAMGGNLMGEQELVFCDGQGGLWFARLAPAPEGTTPWIAYVAPVATAEGDPLVLAGPAAPSVADVNYDGERELIVEDPVTRTVAAYPFVVNGDGMRVGAPFPFRSGADALILPDDQAAGVVATDWQGDGWVDLLAMRRDGAVVRYPNARDSSAIVFGAPVALSPASTRDGKGPAPYLSHLDMNGDGRKDLVATSARGCVRCYPTGGSPEAPVPGAGSSAILPSGQDYAVDGAAAEGFYATFADVTGDGVLDMVFGAAGRDLGCAVAVDARRLTPLLAEPAASEPRVAAARAVLGDRAADVDRIVIRLAEWGLGGC